MGCVIAEITYLWDYEDYAENKEIIQDILHIPFLKVKILNLSSNLIESIEELNRIQMPII